MIMAWYRRPPAGSGPSLTPATALAAPFAPRTSPAVKLQREQQQYSHNQPAAAALLSAQRLWAYQRLRLNRKLLIGDLCMSIPQLPIVAVRSTHT